MDFSRPELFDFQGISMTKYHTDKWEKIQNFQARPNDIIIASYPKAGSTWLSYILDLLYFGSETTHIFRGTEMLDKLPTSPRLIRTHLPVQLMPNSFWEQNCKVVYVARNAKDSVVSYFHFQRMTLMFPEPEEWSRYLQRFMKGKMVFGSWYDHVNGWWKKKQSYSKLHFMFYEDMIEDIGREMDKLCSFLGLSPSAEEKERIIDSVQFDEMKTNDMVNFSGFVKQMNFKVSSFIRKGKVGDWKNHFTVAQNEEFDEDYGEKMKDSTLQFRTEV
ncbi:cytosolic sulfotransferase 3 isoform X2 [Larimichthys crocea]|uniref:cytosolic sulfotransferase 3 isoform X2 n=1 Tax=Larimichthys crocea TaxID=215358 RepID=UPI000F5F3A12|nr:cytosolic sulfotransferase 3 isoform X2 [Larimichthys crocea]